MVDDAWVKATDSDMTAMFGTVMNHSGKDRTIVSAKADVAGMVQLHETVADGSGATTMKEKKGGFPLSAGKSVTLQPGGDHVMLMGLKKKLQAGDTVTVTLTLDDGSAVKVQAPVKPFSGAKETYAPTDSAATHG
jgi:copper(I)-binding protein